MTGASDRPTTGAGFGSRWGRPQIAVITAVMVLAVVAYNVVQNLALPNWTYAVVNVAGAAGALYVGRRIGLTADELGVEPGRLRRGFVVGVVVSGLVVVAIGVIVLLPVARPLFEDARVVDVGVIGGLYEIFVRIPLGTALFEEILFRGLLLGWLLAVTTQTRAIVGSSLLFGVWHILPTLAALDLYQAGALRDAGAAGTALAVIAGVLLTTAFGIAMCGLRIGVLSVAAPVTVHAVVNSFVYASFFFLSASL